MAKKPSKPASAAKKKEPEYNHKVYNPGRGFHGHMLGRYGCHKKADFAHKAVAKHIVQHCKLKGKEYVADHFLASGLGKRLGKDWKNPAKLGLYMNRFMQGYHPDNFKLEEELEVAKINEAEKPFNTKWMALKKAAKETFSVKRGKDNAHVPALGAGAVGTALGGPAVGGAMAAGVYGLAMRDNYKQYRAMRQESEEAAAQFIQDLIDNGATEEEIQFITEERDMSTHAEFLNAVLEEKPHDAKQLFAALMQEKLVENIEAYKVALASSTFNGDKEDDEEDLEDEDEVLDEEELSEEELAEIEEALNELTDEELEELINSYEEEDEEVEEDDEEVDPIH